MAFLPRETVLAGDVKDRFRISIQAIFDISVIAGTLIHAFSMNSMDCSSPVIGSITMTNYGEILSSHHLRVRVEVVGALSFLWNEVAPDSTGARSTLGPCGGSRGPRKNDRFGE